MLERIISAEHVTPQEAVLSILRITAQKRNYALEGLGLFGSPEDAQLLDEVVTMAYEERRRPSKRTASL
jgi:hypothetical protein